MSDDDELKHPHHLQQHETSHDIGVIVRLLMIGIIVAALIVVGLDNRDDVRVGYGFGHKQGPIWVVLLFAALAGVLIGWLMRHRPHRH